MLDIDPRTLLTFKKKIDFKPDYSPKILTESYHWYPPAKLSSHTTPQKATLRSKYSSTFMTTRQERIRQILPASRIKAFTPADILQCAQGDCDRFFTSEVTLRQTKKMTNKQ